MAQEIAEWLIDGGVVVDASSDNAVNMLLLLARSLLDEVISKHENVTNKRKKVAHTFVHTMPYAEMLDRMSESDTDYIVMFENWKKVDKRVTWAINYFDSNNIALILKNAGVDSSDTLSPASEKELKEFMEHLLNVARTIIRMIKRVEKMLDWVFGPLAG